MKDENRQSANPEEVNMRTKSSPFIPHPSSLSRGFTLVELLVVIAIIGVLVSILIPVVGKVRRSSQEAATRALIGQIDAACQAYYSDFNSYPGPLSPVFMASADQNFPNGNGLVDVSNNDPMTSGTSGPGFNGVGGQRITGSENLVLGLMGGLQVDRPSDIGNPASVQFQFNKESVGLGATRFNAKRPGRAITYLQNVNLSKGKFTDDMILKDANGNEITDLNNGSNPSKDTAIPEILDSFSEAMPILYMRARKGGAYDTAAGNPAVNNNNVVVDQTGAPSLRGQYNLLEIAPYTQSSIGVGKLVKLGQYKGHPAAPKGYPHGLISIDLASTLGSKTAASAYPYNAYAYFTEPGSDDGSSTRLQKHRARKQDAYILISAGVDRVYGTEDDLTNFGDVLP